MDNLDKIGMYVLVIAGVLFVFPLLVPRQTLLKVKWEAIPKSIRQPGGFYFHVYKFPFWMLNKYGKLLLVGTCVFGAVGFLLLIIAELIK